jgi:hypothetical protein
VLDALGEAESGGSKWRGVDRHYTQPITRLQGVRQCELVVYFVAGIGVDDDAALRAGGRA